MTDAPERRDLPNGYYLSFDGIYTALHAPNGDEVFGPVVLQEGVAEAFHAAMTAGTALRPMDKAQDGERILVFDVNNKMSIGRVLREDPHFRIEVESVFGFPHNYVGFLRQSDILQHMDMPQPESSTYHVQLHPMTDKMKWGDNFYGLLPEGVLERVSVTKHSNGTLMFETTGDKDDLLNWYHHPNRWLGYMTEKEYTTALAAGHQYERWEIQYWPPKRETKERNDDGRA